MNDLGRQGDYQVDATQNATAFTGANLARYRAVVFLNTSGNRLNGEQEGALDDYMSRGGGFVGIGTAAEAEPGTALLQRPDRRATGPGEPDGRGDADGRRGRPRPSRDARPAARAQPHGRLVSLADAADRHRPHGRALARARRARRRRHDHRRDRPSDLLVPRRPGRALVLHRHGPHRGQLLRAAAPRAPARRDRVGRRPGARQLQGDHQRQLPRHAHRQSAGRSTPASPPAASRTGWWSRRTAG